MKRFVLLLLSAMAFGQGVILPPQQALKVVNGITSPVANATITVCAANTSGMPCSPVLGSALFKDAALTQPLSNPFTSDADGNYVFAIAQGNYTVTVTAAGFAGYSYQTTAPVAGSANNTFSNTNTFNGSTNLNGGGALTGTFSGPATFTGGNTFTGANTLSAKQIENVVYVDTANSQGWSGADACAWIGSAVSSLPTGSGGKVDARGVQGSVTCAGNNFLSSLTVRPVTIMLGAVTINPTTGFLINAVGWNDFKLIGQEGSTTVNLVANQSSGIIMCGAGANSSCSGATSPLLRVHISGITFNGNATCSQTFCGALGVGIQLISCQFCEVDHIRGGGTPQPFIFFSSDSSSQFAHDNHVHDNWITNVWSSNILFTQFATKNEIDNNHIFNTHRNAIDVNGTTHRIHDNFIDTVTQSSGDTFDLRGINMFEGGGGNVANTDNDIYSNTVSNTDQEGIRAESDDANSGNRLIITGNHVNSCGKAAGTGTIPANGISVTTATAGNMLDVIVADNIVNASGKSGSTTGGVGIEVDGMVKAIVRGNIVINSQTDSFHFNNSSSYVVSNNHSIGSRQAASGTFGGFNFNFGALNDIITENTDDGAGSFGMTFTQNTNPMSGLIQTHNQMLGASNQLTTSGTVSFTYQLGLTSNAANPQLAMLNNSGIGQSILSFTNAVDQDFNIGITTSGAGTKFARISPSTNTNLDLGVNSASVARINSGGIGSVGTAATLAGTGACATRSGQLGGSFAGQVTCTGTTGASTLTITPGSTAPNGWTCWANDVTHTLPGSQSTASTTAPVMSFTSVTASDVITFGCNFY